MTSSRLIVIDASAVVALVATRGRIGDLVATAVEDAQLHAPHVMPTEVDSALRGLTAGGHLTEVQADAARRCAAELPVELWPWHPLGDRAWQLRHNLTTYDAGYVALGELLGATVLTIDERIAAAPDLRCPVQVPLVTRDG